MGRGEFEEIFEECLSALLEGRRSVEESLALYPAWRGRLEPLLRSVEEIATGLSPSPPPYARERGLQRFLEAVRTRKRLRVLLPPEVHSTPAWRWLSTGLAAAVVVGALAFASATLLAEDGGPLNEPPQVSLRPLIPAEEPDAPAERSSLERVQESLSALESTVREGEPVEVALLQELGDANADLAAELENEGDMDLIERAAAVSVASKQFELLTRLRAQSSGFEARVVADSLAVAEGVLVRLGALTPEPAEGAAPSPSPAPSPTPSPTVTPRPTAVATPGPTPTP